MVGRYERLETKIQAQLISQEHRLFRIIRNAWVYRHESHGEFHEAARDALILRIVFALLPTAAVAGLGITAVVSLLLTFEANSLVSEQTRVVCEQLNEMRTSRRLSYRPNIVQVASDSSIEFSRNQPFALFAPETIDEQSFADLPQLVILKNTGIGSAVDIKVKYGYDVSQMVKLVTSVYEEAALSITESEDGGLQLIQSDETGSSQSYLSPPSGFAFQHLGSPNYGESAISVHYPGSYLMLISKLLEKLAFHPLEIVRAKVAQIPEVTAAVSYRDVEGNLFSSRVNIGLALSFSEASDGSYEASLLPTISATVLPTQSVGLSDRPCS